MFRPMKAETIERLAGQRRLREQSNRAAIEANLRKAQSQYPQFPWPSALPEANALWLESEGARGPKGYPEAISISASEIKYEQAF